MMKQVKAIIFDLDNTLLDRDRSFRLFSEKLLDTYLPPMDLEIRERMLEHIRATDQDGYAHRPDTYQELLDTLPWGENKPSLEEILGFHRRHYVENTVLMEDAIKVLSAYKGKVKLGLITNGASAAQQAKLDVLGLRDWLDAILVSEEAGVKKPDPRIYEMMLDRLHVSPVEAVFVGDHPVNDIKGASDAGIRTVWLEKNHPWKDSYGPYPEYRIEKLSDLLQVIRTEGNGALVASAEEG